MRLKECGKSEFSSQKWGANAENEAKDARKIMKITIKAEANCHFKTKHVQRDAA